LITRIAVHLPLAQKHLTFYNKVTAGQVRARNDMPPAKQAVMLTPSGRGTLQMSKLVEIYAANLQTAGGTA